MRPCQDCNGKGVLGSCLDMLGDTNPDECPTCQGNGVVAGLTLADVLKVPEVRELVGIVHEHARWLRPDDPVKVALAPFLAAMEAKRRGTEKEGGR